MMCFQGLRVLVVEDEGPIAMMIEDMLQDMGCMVVDSVATIEQALQRIEKGGFDFAFLDMNLGGRNAEAVADALVARDIPFAFGSGYGRAGLPAHLQDRPVLQKPFLSMDLERVIRDCLREKRLASS
jgi:CheY-like chemotaxis protein